MADESPLEAADLLTRSVYASTDLSYASQISTQLGAAQHHVRKALEELVNDGLVEEHEDRFTKSVALTPVQTWGWDAYEKDLDPRAARESVDLLSEHYLLELSEGSLADFLRADTAPQHIVADTKDLYGETPVLALNRQAHSYALTLTNPQTVLDEHAPLWLREHAQQLNNRVTNVLSLTKPQLSYSANTQ